MEEIHSLYRDVYYAYRGHISARQIHAQGNACSCLTLISTCIIYWQALQISKLLKKHAKELDEMGINPDSIAHISPVSWQNVTLYGQYHFNPKMIK